MAPGRGLLTLIVTIAIIKKKHIQDISLNHKEEECPVPSNLKIVNLYLSKSNSNGSIKNVTREGEH